MSAHSLFPDYSVLESGRNEAQAMRLAQQLREVDLQMLVTDPDRRMVVARLRREGIDNAMQLILLTEDEVLQWYNVGPVFVTILAEMRRQVVRNPERIVDEWHHEHRLFVLPDDLNLHHEETDFFGMLMVGEEEVDSMESNAEDNPVVELERCLVAAIEMMEHRTEHGLVLRKYFIEGLPVDTIVSTLNLVSPASLYRIVNKFFREPLLKGYQVKGIQLSDKLLRSIKTLRKSLLYKPANELDVLDRMSPLRFLEFLGLTLLQRTLAESFWSGDYIVREGEVERCRRTLRDLFSSLQFRVVSVKESTIRRGVQTVKSKDRRNTRNAIDPSFLRALLQEHPCIESDRKGYRIVSERLNYDCARLARIVYDAHGPISIDDILSQYERRYMQRPDTISIAHVRSRFPRVRSIRRGVWVWK